MVSLSRAWAERHESNKGPTLLTGIMIISAVCMVSECRSQAGIGEEVEGLPGSRRHSLNVPHPLTPRRPEHWAHRWSSSATRTVACARVLP